MYISTVFLKQTAKPGSLAVESIHVTRIPTFLDYITEGCELTVTGREKKRNKTVEIWRCACNRQEKQKNKGLKDPKKKMIFLKESSLLSSLLITINWVAM